jgi:hypothetical protein
VKFYIARVDGHRTLHHRQDDAKAQDKNFEKIDIPTDMPGLKAFVQELYNEIDTPRAPAGDPDLLDAQPEPALAPRPVPVTESYSHKSIAQDEEFDALPLARQLDFAARAMENAREAL